MEGGEGGTGTEGGALTSAVHTAATAAEEDEALGLTDFFGAVMDGGGESLESVEEAKMQYEDLLSATAPVLATLKKDHDATLALKTQYKMKYQESLGKNELLSKELAAEKARRISLEEDTAKYRNDMKGQMEKLRANMHALLQDKGESSAMMEQRSHEMDREMDERQVGRRRLGVLMVNK